MNLSTALGLILAVVSGTRLEPGPHRLVLARGYTWPLPIAGAFTMGNVVLIRDIQPVTRRLLEHESRHATQWAVCLGLPFVPLYFLAVAWSLIRYGDPASGNFFERAAGLADGGYRPRQPRRLRRRSSSE